MVDDPGGVRGSQTFAELAPDLDYRGEGEPAGQQHLSQRLSGQLLHQVVDPPIGQLANVKDVDDVGVADPGSALRLGTKALDAARVLGQLAVDYLAGAQ